MNALLARKNVLVCKYKKVVLLTLNTSGSDTSGREAESPSSSLHFASASACVNFSSTRYILRKVGLPADFISTASVIRSG